MPKITMPLKVEQEVKDFLEYDSFIKLGKKNLNGHANHILTKYMETRPPLPSNWKELIEDKKEG